MKDESLWSELAKKVKPLKKQPVPKKPLKKINIKQDSQESGVKLTSYGLKDLEKGDISAMDKANGTRLRKGKIRPDARLDLHGYTVDKAFEVLQRFIEKEYNKGSKCVIVVTGRGKAVMDEMGRLTVNTGKIYNELPKWLNCPDIRGYIVSFTAATSFDGGEGAVYIYLRSVLKDKKAAY